MRLPLLMAAATVLSASLAAHADPVTFTFDNATFASGATLTGTVAIDTTTGLFTSIDATYTLGGTSLTLNQFDLQYSPTPTTFPIDNPGFTTTFVTDSTGDALTLTLVPDSLVGYTGSDLCSTTVFCYSHTAFESAPPDNLVSGSLVLASDTAATPEPSTFALLGTGFLGFAGIVRRRLA